MTSAPGRPIGLPFTKRAGRGLSRAKSEDTAVSNAPRKAPKAGRASAVTTIREPRVNLLPIEVHVDRRERTTARRAWIGVGVAVAVVLLATGAAVAHQLDSASSLAAAQEATSSLLAQQQRYAEVRSTEADTQLLESAQAVGGSTEVDWETTLSGVRAALPEGVGITAMTIDSADATQVFEQSSVPLQGARIATMTLTVQTTTIPSVPDWNDRLSSVVGYAGSTISSISLNEDSGEYTAVVELALDEAAYDGKYTEGADR
jgi:Tfp pilus assembly protein PilN